MRNRRKTYLIDRKFQLKYMLYLVCLLLLHSLLVVESIYAPYVYSMFSSSSAEHKAETARVILSLHSNVGIPVVVMIVLVALLSVFLTHRIAGPVYRIKTDLRAMADGNLSQRIILRKYDEFKELADECNRLADTMSTVVGEVRRGQADLAAGADALEAAIKTGGKEDALAVLEKLRKIEKNLDQALGRLRS